MATEKCEKCGGAIINDYGRPVCINCGEVYLSPEDRRAWFHKHIADLVRDLDKLGAEGIQAKYKLRPQYIAHIKSSPEYLAAHPELGVSSPGPAKREHQVKRKRRPAAPSLSSAMLPALPAWREDWSDTVKVVWLDAWARARGK